jgi:hypothetical protein
MLRKSTPTIDTQSKVIALRRVIAMVLPVRTIVGSDSEYTDTWIPTYGTQQAITPAKGGGYQ